MRAHMPAPRRPPLSIVMAGVSAPTTPYRIARRGHPDRQWPQPAIPPRHATAPPAGRRTPDDTEREPSERRPSSSVVAEEPHDRDQRVVRALRVALEHALRELLGRHARLEGQRVVG